MKHDRVVVCHLRVDNCRRYNIVYHLLDFDFGEVDSANVDCGDAYLFSRAATRLLSLPKFLSTCFDHHAHDQDDANHVSGVGMA